MRRGAAVALAVALAGGAALAVVALRETPLREAVASPETQVRASLRALPSVRLDLAGGGAAVLDPVRFPDVAVWPDGDGAGVIAMVEGEGRVEAPGGEGAPPAVVALAYIGREQFRVERAGPARWRPAGSPAPALEAVLAALLDRAARGAREGIRVRAWQVRIERDRATAGEDQEQGAPGGGAAGAVRRRAVHDLLRQADGRWVIAEGR